MRIHGGCHPDPSDPSAGENEMLKAEGLSNSDNGVRALEDLDPEVRRGDIHAFSG